MRRITTWLAVTLTVVGLATYYQVASRRRHGRRAPGRSASAADPARRRPAEGADAGRDEKAEDPCAQSEHTGKPGENKD